MLIEADLPEDVEALRALVLEQARELDTLKTFRDEVERLRAIIEAMQRHRFGRRSEQLDPDQFELALEEVEAALAVAEHAQEQASKQKAERPRKTNRGSLPTHLERIEQVVDVESHARDDRPWGGSDPPMVTYVYAADRKAERPEAHLEGFAGILQVDGYGGYAALARRRGDVTLAFCWAHVRRKFYELADSSPVASDVLRRIAELYAIEDEVRGSSARQRQTVRNARSRPIVDDLYQYLDTRGRQVSTKSRLGEAIRYALTRWDGLLRFLDDGRIDLDNNTVERSIRPLALNRKNALFAGSDEGGDNWAVIATLIENCKLNGIDPNAWLTATLSSLANGHPANRVSELLPWADVG